MGNYLNAKKHFEELSNKGTFAASGVLEEYDEVKRQCGEFVAAKFLRDIYILYQENMDLVKNG